MHLSFDLGLDSLDVANLYCFLDDRYEVNYLPHGELRLVEDLLKAAFGHKLVKEESVDVQPKLSKWSKEKTRKNPMPPDGKTIPEAFLFSCRRMRGSLACTDLLSGSKTYTVLKKNVLVFALKIKELPGDHIGILLPSSISATSLILGCMLAKKVPVMLNWRAGMQCLQQSVKLTGIEVVLSSYRFLGKLENGELQPLEELFLFSS